MSCVHLTSIPSVHAYTREDTPWILGEYRSAAYGKLIHYLSGGGMTTFGRTIAQELARRRQNRALVVAAVLLVGWVVFYFL